MHFQRRKYPHDSIADHPYLAGLLTGMVAGLTVGFLFAPRSGKELRKQIVGTVNDQTKDLQHQWDKTSWQAKQTINTIKTNVGLAADEAEDEFGRYVDRARQQAHKAEKEADEALKEADRLAREAKSSIDTFKDTRKLG
ncbi:YtxH domain-containing protein [Spirosoma validum]|uniref:YtxH domain-containing protein n=1 Tax=Spirosoma validum TaxID=2771355 RepID=A0A927B9H8_9BACT|nr:YtxH domain-containing protein [Spirosoma validum]MBD2757698.1 YtxH domain-containing protein [Spirosoma validum]